MNRPTPTPPISDVTISYLFITSTTTAKPETTLYFQRDCHELNRTTVSKILDDKPWKAADKLRANLDAANDKHIVLGIIFLKYRDQATKIDQRMQTLLG